MTAISVSYRKKMSRLHLEASFRTKAHPALNKPRAHTVMTFQSLTNIAALVNLRKQNNT